MDYFSLHERVKQQSLYGRYITLDHIEESLLAGARSHRAKVEGTSVDGRKIYSYTIGSGTIKILMWSQMHGNESTATKAIFDLLNLLDEESELGNYLLQKFTFCIVPMLNPDGAFLYTRANYKGVDLNRDFVNISQPETAVLINLCKSLQPDFCYNLHDQRTIFGAGNSGKSATISFLSPAFNEQLDVNPCRFRAMHIINQMNIALQQLIPQQVGRFDDAFNLNCVGDNFQNLGFSTILIEAGHQAGDYQREESRFYVFVAIVSGLLNVSQEVKQTNVLSQYLSIPENHKNFRDIIYRNIVIQENGNSKMVDIAIQYDEVLVSGDIAFIAIISEIGELKNLYGHVTIHTAASTYSDNLMNIPLIGQKADFFLDKTSIVVNGLIKM